MLPGPWIFSLIKDFIFNFKKIKNQGYLNCACFKAGTLGESSCPAFCLALESCLCLGPSMSSSRNLVMDTYDLRPDPCDNRLIRFSNCCECIELLLNYAIPLNFLCLVQLASCLVHILAVFIEELRDFADYVRLAADLVFYTMLGWYILCVSYVTTSNHSFNSQYGGPVESWTRLPAQRAAGRIRHRAHNIFESGACCRCGRGDMSNYHLFCLLMRRVPPQPDSKSVFAKVMHQDA